MFLLEIACFNLESALLAQQAGADRIELCADYSAGGLTPGVEVIQQARQQLSIPLHVIIRPTALDFKYTEAEFEKMKQAIEFCKSHHVNGVVLGVLNGDNTINRERTKQLIDLARPMSVTFHRAFDECPDLVAAMESLIDLGVDRVLTSGGRKTALEGKEILRGLQDRYGDKIGILPGGGIRSSNLKELLESTGCKEFHSAAITSGTELADAAEIKALKSLL